MHTDTHLLEALPAPVYLTDETGMVTFYNDQAAEVWGRRPAPASARWSGAWRLYWPDGRPMAHDECPLARSLQEGQVVRDVVIIVERPDGTRMTIMPCPNLLRDDDGRVVGAINLLVDVGHRTASDIEAARLAAIVSSSDDAIISKTLDGIVRTWNAGATRIFGYESDEIVGRSITTIIPPELLDEEKEILAKLRSGERIDHFDTVRVAKDGRRLHISLTVSPVRDGFGTIVGASKVARDVTERKRAEDLQRILFDELNHRVKNSLAMIQAIATQSMRGAADPTQFVESFNGRVQALARAHDLLVKGGMQGADVGELVRAQVRLGAEADARISTSGPRAVLGSRIAVQLALVLHELATNASKYGALATPAGQIAIQWDIESRADRQLHLEWRETGVANVTAPVGHGFGMGLIERTARANGGEASIRYAAGGIVCDIRIPIVEDDYLAAALTHDDGLAVPPPPGDVVIAGKRVALIEDEPLVAMEMEAFLADVGCSVVGPAGTLEAALRLVAEGGCDLALLDGNLLGQPVDEVAALLARHDIPFAFVSGYGREALPAAFRSRPLLAKPFRADQLLATLKGLAAAAPAAADVIPIRRA